MKIMRYSSVFLFFCFLIFSFSPPPRLSAPDVRKTMEEMLAYHVDYKSFNSMLARRSIKLYLEQFDLEKKYLLAKEAQGFFNLSEDQLQKIVQKYQKDDLSEFAAKNQVIERAILRARRIRAEIEKELIIKDAAAFSQEQSYEDYSRDEAELKNRIRLQLTRLLLLEKKWSKLQQWGPEDRKKVFALWERRLARYENPYLMVDLHGKGASQDVVNHYLIMHVLKAMAKSLDAHTAYFSPEEAFEMRASLEKQFEGIGIVLREGINGVLISDLIKGGPAEKSQKIAPGDLIMNIDGYSVDTASYEEILKRLQGSDTTGRVRIGLKRLDSQGKELYYEVDLKREKIVMEDERLQYTFEPYADGIIAKLTLPSFYESGGSSSCEKDIRDALQALRKEGTIYGVVLDLRENSGGFLSQAVKVAGLFISSGVIVVSKYAQGEVQYLREVDARSYYSGPLVILTSKASASAAEIVAQALQDYGVALIVGDQRTYGKGTIQYQTVTDTRAATFFKVTVGRYYTVSGRSTQIEGVKADIVVPTLYSPYNIGEKYLEYALKSDQIPSVYVDPLLDVDQRNQAWFQRNYLPNIQKKLSSWTQMLPHLKRNSAFRLSSDKNYQLFLQSLEPQKLNRFTPTSKENWGVDDLQMMEAVSIIKDMMIIQAAQEMELKGSL